jgi:hypothetical protein
MVIFLDAPTLFDLAKHLAAHAWVRYGPPEAAVERADGRDSFVV